MDDILKKQLKKTILKTISNGIAFEHMTEVERDIKERDLVYFIKSKGYDVVVEQCMIVVFSLKWEKILMMELTRNTLYFSPIDVSKTTEIVFYVLEFTAKDYISKMTTSEKTKIEEKEVDPDEEDTEEDPPTKPSFDFL